MSTQMKVAAMLVPVILLFCTTVIISAFVFHDHHHCKVFAVVLHFLLCSLWMIYGLLSHDMFLASPNIAATPLGLLQLIVYCIYRKKGIMEEPSK
ncbi:hypothetical protein EZV62_006051 [Acer yangbiense]|uniref:Bidirectional sugar transporter SWEET n=1 Tax=Acer yangbiense TaxID=1000413 RepID=A0A5C7IRN3_9ROSI|nr:hypothetical protein EZV62_006051 [Acer yangbiense]